MTCHMMGEDGGFLTPCISPPRCILLKAGAGKSVLASIVVDHLQNMAAKTSKTAVLYLYCDYKIQSQQTCVNFIRSLVAQIYIAGQEMRLVSCGKALVRLYEDYKRRNEEIRRNNKNEVENELKEEVVPSLGEFKKVLKYLIGDFQQIYTVIDALDEVYTNEQRDFITALRELVESPHVRIFVTSRPIDYIKGRFSGSLQLDIVAKQEDLMALITAHLRQEQELVNLVKGNPQLQKDIAKAIVEKSQGMFLIAEFHLRILRAANTPKEALNALANLPGDIDGIYQKIIERLGTGPTFDLAKLVLLWVTFAFKPLKVKQIQHAIAVQLQSEGESNFSLEEDSLIRVGKMVSACGGLVILEDDTLRLVHYTASKYLRESTLFGRYPHARIAATCMEYLSLEYSPSGRDAEGSLLQYAATSWGVHAQEAMEQPKELRSRIMHFLAYHGERISDIHWHAHRFRQAGWELRRHDPRLLRRSNLHSNTRLGQMPVALAVEFGLCRTLAHILTGQDAATHLSPAGFTRMGFFIRRELSWPWNRRITNHHFFNRGTLTPTNFAKAAALQTGSVKTIKALISPGIEVFPTKLAEHSRHMFPYPDLSRNSQFEDLEVVVLNGHTEAAQLMLDNLNLTKLDISENSANEEMADLLVRVIIELDAPDKEAMLRVILDWRHFRYETAAWVLREIAWIPQREHALRLLLEAFWCTAADKKSENDFPPIRTQTGHRPSGSTEVSRRRVLGSCFMDSVYRHSLRSSLVPSLASVKLFLESGAELDFRRARYPLTFAISRGFDNDAVQLLLSISGVDADWGLLFAVPNGDAVRHMLRLGVRADGGEGALALFKAAARGSEEVVRLLLDAGARPGADTVAVAASQGYESIVTLLLLDGRIDLRNPKFVIRGNSPAAEGKWGMESYPSLVSYSRLGTRKYGRYNFQEDLDRVKGHRTSVILNSCPLPQHCEAYKRCAGYHGHSLAQTVFVAPGQIRLKSMARLIAAGACVAESTLASAVHSDTLQWLLESHDSSVVTSRALRSAIEGAIRDPGREVFQIETLLNHYIRRGYALTVGLYEGLEGRRREHSLEGGLLADMLSVACDYHNMAAVRLILDLKPHVSTDLLERMFHAMFEDRCPVKHRSALLPRQLESMGVTIARAYIENVFGHEGNKGNCAIWQVLTQHLYRNSIAQETRPWVVSFLTHFELPAVDNDTAISFLCAAVKSFFEKDLINPLLKFCHNLNYRDKWGDTPLTTACTTQSWCKDEDGTLLEAARVLVNHGADVNFTDGHGHTPLLLAVMTDNFEIVQYLLSKGADLTLADKEGRTIQHYAENGIKRGYKNYIKMFEKWKHRVPFSDTQPRGENGTRLGPSLLGPIRSDDFVE
ncbi:hypothetical protein DFH27DRAFT_289143 [Peziza echinospora]|nr:hypothetical protein DFH27DRAFT_289143 [Peziza echinospora]